MYITKHSDGSYTRHSVVRVETTYHKPLSLKLKNLFSSNTKIIEKKTFIYDDGSSVSMSHEILEVDKEDSHD